MHLGKKAALAIAFASLSLPHVALGEAAEQTTTESEWVFVASNSDDTDIYSVKKGSFEITTTKGGTSIAVVLGQIEDKEKKIVSYSKWYVATDDCDSGIGKLVILKLNGDFDFETDYVAKGNNVGSSIADTICMVYRSTIAAQKSKGV